jgi:TM2 domain-containing membrane protein YozV
MARSAHAIYSLVTREQPTRARFLGFTYPGIHAFILELVTRGNLAQLLYCLSIISLSF